MTLRKIFNDIIVRYVSKTDRSQTDKIHHSPSMSQTNKKARLVQRKHSSVNKTECTIVEKELS